MLSDRTIRIALSKGYLSISPLDEKDIQSNSVDLHLNNTFRVFENHKYVALDVTNIPENVTYAVELGEHEEFVLHPGELVLACTKENIQLGTHISGLFLGKSSLARVGLIVESAGLCDAGFRGEITIELANISNIPLILKPGIKIGQLCLFNLSTDVVNAYGSETLRSHYQNQTGPTPSRLKSTGVK